MIGIAGTSTRTAVVSRFVVLLSLWSGAALAATPLSALRYAPDITVVLGGVTVTPQNVAEDNLAGGVSLVNISGVPDGTHIIAYDELSNDDSLLAFDTPVKLPGGLVVRPADVVRFDGTTYTLEFDATANSIPDGAMVDAIALISPDNLLLSFDITLALGNFTAAPEDIVRFTNGVFSPFFSGAAAGVPLGLNLDAVDCLVQSGHLLLSFDGSGTGGGVNFDDEDVLEYSPENNSWAQAYDGSAQHAGWPPADLAAVSATSITVAAVAPMIGGSMPGPGGMGGQGGLVGGTTRVFGLGTPNGKAGDSCIRIYTVGGNGMPDIPPGSVDDELIGIGGTDANGNFVDASDNLGIELTRALGEGERLFATDVCNDLVGPVVSRVVPSPALSHALLSLLVALLALIGLRRVGQSRRSG